MKINRSVFDLGRLTFTFSALLLFAGNALADPKPPSTTDCNANGVPDICDVSTAAACPATDCVSKGYSCAASVDCNDNGVPDECDTNIALSSVNDRCGDAEQIAPGITYYGDTTDLLPENSASNCQNLSGAEGSKNGYYLYVPATDGTLTVSTCSILPSFDTVVSVHDSCPLGQATELACNNDDPTAGGCGPQSRLSLAVQAGKRYWISVSGVDSKSKGFFTLSITGPGSGQGRDDCNLNGVPDSCDPDSDGDRVPDGCDNCPALANADQLDSDDDGLGDLCDPCPFDAGNDADHDGICGNVDICAGSDDRIDTDGDGVPDGCDNCASVSNASQTDSDHDGLGDACDACPLDPSNDADGDRVCGDIDICAGFDDRVDTDLDGIPDGCDTCPLDPLNDSDHDTVCGNVDLCPGSDDRIDADGDLVPDGCDNCPSHANSLQADADHDGFGDACDACPLDAANDADGDGVCGNVDICPGHDDHIDSDGDGIPDGCDACPLDPANDADKDGVCGNVDICPGHDDRVDSDSDGTPDGCDACPLDAANDADGDGVCGNVDVCPGHDDHVDADGDGTPDGCDACPLDAANDADHDGVCGNVDICPGHDDHVDADSDGIPDGCDACPLDAANDADHDGVCGNVDICPGFDDHIDSDSDGVPDGCDACPLDAANDADKDGVCGNVDICPGFDDHIDADSDGVPDGCDACPLDAENDADDDGVCGNVDICPGFDDRIDTDHDGIPDGCDACPLDAANDADHDGVCGNVDICAAGDDHVDADSDGTPDGCDQCPSDAAKTAPGACGCGNSDVDANNNGIADCNDDHNDKCPEGQECIFDDLLPTACAGANGFLKQINIASVINLLARPLHVTVTYTGLDGTLRGSVSATLDPNLKQDFIINDMGLEADTYGTVCVSTDATEPGSWAGGVTLYKPDERLGANWTFGAGFDFALYHPFKNPVTGQYTQPLNTYHLGVDSTSTVANWVSITDGDPNDGFPLTGKLMFFDSEGKPASSKDVNIPDSGRFDFSGHEGIAGMANVDAIGMVRFLPDALPNGQPAKYYIVVARYFYDCFGASCSNFHTAFVVPQRPATTVALNGGVSTVGNVISVVELNNTVGSNSLASNIEVFSGDGVKAATEQVLIPPLGTRHYIVNRTKDAGALADDTVGSATVKSATSDSVSALGMFYKLDQFGKLAYAFATPMTGTPGFAQVSEYNSFIGQSNIGEFFNPGNITAKVQLQAVDYKNATVYQTEFDLAPKATSRILLGVPADSYGTLIVQSTGDTVVFRNFVTRPAEYVLPFGGR